jgi:hypothetical protein
MLELRASEPLVAETGVSGDGVSATFFGSANFGKEGFGRGLNEGGSSAMEVEGVVTESFC